MKCHIDLPLLSLGDKAADNDLARLFWGTYPIEGAAAVCKYIPGSPMAGLLHEMKYRRKAELCRYVGRLIATDSLAQQILSDADMLLPVPLTTDRQRMRGYNQAEQICEGIATVQPLPIVTDVLKRVRFVDSQTSMTAAERRENIHGAFEVLSTEHIKGKHIVVVDDVITTGATISECIRMLNTVPNLRISILSFLWTRGF